MLCEECQKGQKLIEEIDEEINTLKQFPSRKNRIQYLIKQQYDIRQEMSLCEKCNNNK